MGFIITRLKSETLCISRLIFNRGAKYIGMISKACLDYLERPKHPKSFHSKKATL
jgi:hypothetical protein